MLRIIISVFLLGVVPAWGNVVANKKTVAAVFHQNYCDAIPQAIELYHRSVEEAGYQLLSVCTKTKSVTAVKRQIQQAASNMGIAYNHVEGVNLFGPVISTRVSPKLHSGSRVLFAIAELAFDDLWFVYQDDVLVDVNAGYFMPAKIRWVSHQLPQSDLQIERMVEVLRLDSDRLNGASGEVYARKVLERIGNFRPEFSDTLLQWPTGVVWNFALPGVIYGLWKLAGWSRERASTDVVRLQTGINRFQTWVDIPGNGVMYAGMALIGGWSAYSLFWHIFGKALPDGDWRWKRALFHCALREDGLLDYQP